LKVLYDYEATRDDETGITAGDIITVLEKTDVNWWKVGEDPSGKSGYVPSSYLEELTGEASDAVIEATDKQDPSEDSGTNPFASSNNLNPFGSSANPTTNAVSDFDWGSGPTPGKAADFSTFSLEPKANVIRKV
jgi:hypothetical protein